MARNIQNTSSTLILTFGDISYLVRNRVEYVVSDAEIAASTIPAIVMHSEPNVAITLDFVQNCLNRLSSVDDVCTSDFAKNAVLIVLHETDQPPKTDTFLTKSAQTTILFQNIYSKESLPEGPYFLQGQELHQSWRLYPDYLGAFTTTIIPDDVNPGRFTTLKVTSDDGFDLAIAVPSRLYSPRSSSKPLNGLRVSVKDNYHIAGTITTLGSRSYANLYGVQNKTSAYVERLIGLGCIIVGKTKLSSFSGTEAPPKGPIDYLAPFIPRADMYQAPAGSSLGAASAISGYEWLDISLATDTTGSTRAPAASSGVWALRPTWDSISMEGIVRSVELFDTVGLMARDSEILRRFHHVSVGKFSSEQKLPTRLLYPTDWFPASNDKHQEMVNTFTSSLEKYLGVTRIEVSLCELWLQTAPDEVQGEPLNEFVAEIGYNINMWDGYHNFTEFREEYERKFDKAPYISPVQSSKWDGGRKVTPEQRAEAMRRRKLFADWTHENVLRNDRSTIMVVWWGNPEPVYRDEVPTSAPNRFPGSYNPNFFSTILGFPNAIIPVGQIPFTSRVTKRTEYLPAAAGLIGGPGMDEIILQVSQGALKLAGCPTKVLPGRLAFNLGDEMLIVSDGEPVGK